MIIISECQSFIRDAITENKVKDIIIQALKDAGYDIEIDIGILKADDYDTNNGVSVKRLWRTDTIAITDVSTV